MRLYRFSPLSFILMLGASLLGFAGGAAALSSVETSSFTLRLATADFGRQNLTPEFSAVRDFAFEFDLTGAFANGQRIGNGNVDEVRYIVSGALSRNPLTPSGFSAFRLNRFPNGEGPISREDWLAQGSRIEFKIASDALLGDGLQLSELVPGKKNGAILTIDAREFKRLDVARYHPPQLLLYPDGTGLLRSSNNSSGGTGTVNPGTGRTVDLDFGDEYITNIDFDPSAITIVAARPGTPVPEPGPALLIGLGLAALASRSFSKP